MQINIRRVGIFFLGIFLWQQAEALPAYARQTGMNCAGCHVGGMGPQLTPFGQSFKIGGYTLRNSSDFILPLSAMLVATYEHTAKDLPDPAGPHDKSNNNVNLQEASLFVAGALTEHVGSFAQMTYSDVDRLVVLDNVDIRYANQTEWLGKGTTYGVSLNNNPGLQDPWNNLPAWRFTYTASALAPTPGAATLINGGLEQQVIGASVYAYWNSNVYAEFGTYQSLSPTFLDDVNVGSDAGQIAHTAPYWRIAYNTDINGQSIMVGLFGLRADLYPDHHAGLQNHYDDVGIDTSYQYLMSGNHQVTFNGSYVHEKQKLDYSLANGDASRDSLYLNELNFNIAYYFQNTYGFRLGYSRSTGSSDNILYAPSPLDGSRSGKPDSSAYTFQVDWTPFGKQESWGAPWANIRVGVQYIDYLRFNGSSNNYDGFGRDAADNNTLYLFVWTAI